MVRVTNCEECVHKNVCKYREDLTEFSKSSLSYNEKLKDMNKDFMEENKYITQILNNFSLNSLTGEVEIRLIITIDCPNFHCQEDTGEKII